MRVDLMFGKGDTKEEQEGKTPRRKGDTIGQLEVECWGNKHTDSNIDEV